MLALDPSTGEHPFKAKGLADPIEGMDTDFIANNERTACVEA